tara:strand:- start:31 stop:1092 length:1062 start_codon:yes stop_codon:yes gene_type:complete
MSQNYYDVLGINKNASKDEIKKSYRKIAMKYHPDKNPGDKSAEEKFKKAAEAYSVLSDDAKKSNYDQFGTADVSGGFGRGGGINVNDIFNSFFGKDDPFGNPFSRRGRKKYKNKGSDIQIRIPVTFEQSYHGDNITINVKCDVQCVRCNGTGSNTNHTPPMCQQCQGMGELQQRQNVGFMNVINNVTCNNCNGLGYILINPCHTCNGNGVSKGDKKIKINIPKGVINENYSIYNGNGNSGIRNGAPGNLIVYFNVQNDSLYDRKGNDLYSTLDLKFSQVLMGDDLQLNLICGKTDVHIPKYSKNGDLIKLKNKGFNVGNNVIGDYFLKINVDVPSNLTDDQIDLINKLKEVGL